MIIFQGYVNTTFKALIDTPSQGFLFGLGAYDRYTGNHLKTSSKDMVGEQASAEYVYTLEVDGASYDCRYYANWVKLDSEHYEATVTINHPVEYDGVVFKMGKKTASMDAFECDCTGKCKLAAHPELLEGQYYFTATNN